MAFISNATTIIDAGAFSANLGSLVHIKTLTGSNVSNLSFVHGTSSVVFDGTYAAYQFFIQLNPAVNEHSCIFKTSTDSGSNYTNPMTTTYWYAYHQESDGSTGSGYEGQADLAQGTSGQFLNIFHGNNADDVVTGVLTIFNPANTTFVKQFLGDFTYNNNANYPANSQSHIAGYINTTSAVNAIQFATNSGNLDGVIKMYGIKDS